jgi:hypothetical protein
MRLDDFDYSCPAEVYTAGWRRGGKQSMAYRRFDTAAKAIRYSIEELPETSLPRTTLEVDEDRYRHTEIRALYDSGAYPLRRRTKEAGDGTQAQLSV